MESEKAGRRRKKRDEREKRCENAGDEDTGSGVNKKSFSGQKMLFTAWRQKQHLREAN